MLRQNESSIYINQFILSAVKVRKTKQQMTPMIRKVLNIGSNNQPGCYVRIIQFNTRVTARTLGYGDTFKILLGSGERRILII